MSNTKKVSSAKPLFHLIVMFAIVAIFYYLPPVAPLTGDGMYMLGVFFGFIYGVVAWQIAIPSLWGIFMLGFSALIGPAVALSGSFGNFNTAAVLLLFIVIQLIQDEDIHKVIATWSMSRKFIQGKPVLYSVAILLVSVLLGVVSMFLSCFVVWAILYGLFEALGYKKHETYPVIMLIGVAYFAMTGLILFPFIDNGLIIMSSYAAITGSAFPYIKYIIVMLPCILVQAFAWVLVGKHVFHMDMSKIANANESMLDMECLNLTKRQKATLIEVVLLLVLIMAQSLLPKGLPILGFLTATNLYTPILIVIIVGVIWHIDGEPLVNVPSLLSRGFMIETWFLIAFIMLLSSYLTSADTGITAFCVSVLQPALNGVPVYAIVVIVMIFTFVATNIANNLVTILCVIPVMYSLSTAMGFALEPVILVVIMASHIALLTPAASGLAAVIFGNDEWLSRKDIYKYTPLLLIVVWLICLTVGYVWANVIF